MILLEKIANLNLPEIYPMQRNKNFPLFIIDRSKPESYPFDFIVCTHPKYGFVAKIIIYNTNHAYYDFIDKSNDLEIKQDLVLKKMKQGGLVLQIESFFSEFEKNESNLKKIYWFANKALSKYI